MTVLFASHPIRTTASLGPYARPARTSPSTSAFTIHHPNTILHGGSAICWSMRLRHLSLCATHPL